MVFIFASAVASAAEPAKAKTDHWSFKPVATIKPPQVKSEFVQNPIDSFVIQKLAGRKLQPSTRADRRTRIRRLYLVMHGLPPTQAQIKQFLEDKSPNAWGALVDRVLKSPRYGERWARHWLDLIRFGETYGFEMNRERPHAWPFRDYVIRSLNDDKPYDEFVREQIAGDAIGSPIGTGFLVAGPKDQVGGGGNLRAIQRMNELDDMINTTGTTFLGLTLGCARCHDHMFDPVTQVDYYAMQAIFAGVKHADRDLPPSAATKQKLAALDQEIAGLAKKLARFVLRSPIAPTAAVKPPFNSKYNVEVFKARKAKFVRFTIEKSNRGQACIDELEIYSAGKNVALASAGAKATASGSLKGYAIHKLAHINDGKLGNPHSWICDKKQGWVQIELPEAVMVSHINWGRDRTGKFTDRVAVSYRVETALEAGKWQPATRWTDRVMGGAASKKSAKQVYDFSKSTKAEAEHGRKWLARLSAAQSAKATLLGSNRAYVGTFSQPGPTHLLYRGEPDQKKQVVGPGAVAALTPLKMDAKSPEQKRRLALANWIASKKNPLTARVIVNRLWQHHFGTGIVDTPSDFGGNGTAPTHPKLLDWLAGELMANGWSLKHVHQLILTSSTWQQDSRPNKEGVATDGAVRLLWRYPPRRLEAEAIRDSMLAVSGVLDLRMGGPGFSGFAVQKENVRHYFPKAKYGPEDFRRMIYMTKVRQEQESVFGAFDCPDASQVAPKRSRSTTPLQAFNLLNSSFVMQQAGLFAQRLEAASPKPDATRAALAFELTFGRPATAVEAEGAFAFAAKHGWPALCRAMFNANEFVFVP